MNPYALLDPAVSTLYHLLVLLAATVPDPDRGVRYAVALAALTIGVRVALLPLALRALHARRAKAALEPQLAELRRRHGRDPKRLLAETARLHQEAGVPQTAGLGATLAQLPVVATVYRLVVVQTVAGGPNLLLAARLFGAPMAAHWPEVLAAGGVLAPGSIALVAIVVTLTALAVLSSQDITRAAAEQAGGAAPGRGAAETAGPAVLRITRLLPFATVAVALVAPVAMGIYLVVSTAWTVAERRLLPRLVPA